MRAAIYARVSSAAQRDAHTIENQLRVLPAFVASQGWDLVGTFIDDGRSAKSGMLGEREGFAELVRLLVEPGSVVFRGRDVRLSLAVPRSSGASGLSGPASGTFAGTNAPLRIRLVA